MQVRWEGSEKAMAGSGRAYPGLGGTLGGHVTANRRPFLRFLAGEGDWSREAPAARLPEAVVKGSEPFMVVGAIAGG
jgi:hypothetical protein